MAQAKITLNNGNVVEISGSAGDVEKILALYPDPIGSVIVSNKEKIISEVSSFSVKSRRALEWAQKQAGRSVQQCNTSGCKYNYDQPGATVCKKPNPRADDDDVKQENHKDYHPLWNFYCMRFVRASYGAPADYAKAEDMYQAFSRIQAISTGDDIPRGALVFWHWSSYGHIGIYVGEGKVIHTGVNPSKKTTGIRESPLNEITSVLNGYNHYESDSARTSYLGWAYPPEKWLS